MQDTRSFDNRIADALATLRPSEARVVRYLRAHREDILLASAAQLARSIGTSDATVIRAIKALGYERMEALRREIASDLQAGPSPASRLARTVNEIGSSEAGTLAATLAIHRTALDELEAAVTPALYDAVVARLAGARRVAVFGIGPSSAVADYFMIQLGRFGIETLALTSTGLFLADGLLRLARGDVLVIIAYGRVYAELAALIERAAEVGALPILVTDTLGRQLGGEIDLVLSVPRGKTGLLAMHTATLAFIEALLVGIATVRPTQTIASLGTLNALRTKVSGRAVDLAPRHNPDDRYPPAMRGSR